ncbi:MAG: hypothetical protein DMF91_23510 [Acidobacteria bacterium]|nr:MAG: hypothetical protein DMF91_23510 [Acidobacteriota bacterium]
MIDVASSLMVHPTSVLVWPTELSVRQLFRVADTSKTVELALQMELAEDGTGLGVGITAAVGAGSVRL